MRAVSRSIVGHGLAALVAFAASPTWAVLGSPSTPIEAGIVSAAEPGTFSGAGTGGSAKTSGSLTGGSAASTSASRQVSCETSLSRSHVRMPLREFGYHRVAAVSPWLELGNPEANATIIIKEAQHAAARGATVTVFSELGFTGYTVEDHFHNNHFLQRTRQAMARFMKETASLDAIFIVGAPYRTFDGRLYNAAFVVKHGKILGAIPKTHLPNYKEFKERRYFVSGRDVDYAVEDNLLGDFRLKTNQLFKIDDLVFGVEICEDMWATRPPSDSHTLAGANMIFNLSASNDLVGKREYRTNLINMRSGINNAAYAYASAGPGESSRDLIFGGHVMISENGSTLADSRQFSFEGDRVFADIDVERLMHERAENKTNADEPRPTGYDLINIRDIQATDQNLERKYAKNPFVPHDPAQMDARSREIIQFLATALKRRLIASHAETAVIGISGGRDSTLALLVTIEAVKLMGWPMDRIRAYTMPGAGTSKETLGLANDLMDLAGVHHEEIPIGPAVEQHFKDIGHDPKDTKAPVYGNSYARERTQILLDLANKHRGIVIGTGTLSELWLGWCTYNGDHISNYGVNPGVPKTLVEYLINWYANSTSDLLLADTLRGIVAIPMSPELEPLDAAGRIVQKTEDQNGPYIVHDFWMYHYVKGGFGPQKLYYLARHAFADDPRFTPEHVKTWLRVFFKRRYENAFKTTTLPPGVKIGSVSLSPRDDFRMPDDMSAQWILDEIELLHEREAMASALEQVESIKAE